MPQLHPSVQELIDIIIDFVHSDRESLKACSLVCRAWVAATRYHLFGSIRVAHYATCCIQNLGNAQAFLAIMESPVCTIQWCIKELSLEIADDAILRDVVTAVSRSAGVLTKLSLTLSMPPDIPLDRSLSHIARALPNIADLTVFPFYCLSHEVLHFIARFHDLRRLSIKTETKTVVPKDIFVDAIFSTLNVKNLTSLQLELQASEETMYHLMTSTQLPQLATLDLCLLRSYSEGVGPVDVLNSFLKASKDTLKDLRIEIKPGNHSDKYRSDEFPVTSCKYIDLEGLYNLRTFSAAIHEIDAVCETLSSIDASTRLESLSIRSIPLPIHWRYDEQVRQHKEFLWSRINSIVEKPQFGDLRVLDVKVIPMDLKAWH